MDNDRIRIRVLLEINFTDQQTLTGPFPLGEKIFTQGMPPQRFQQTAHSSIQVSLERIILSV